MTTLGYLTGRLEDVPPGDGWLTAAERRWLSGRRAPRRIADWRLWSAKESALKSLRRGLRADTRSVEVTVPGGAADEGVLRVVVASDGLELEGRWWRLDGLVATVVSHPTASEIVDLATAAEA